MRELFTAEEPEWILVKPRVETQWPALSNILEGHTENISGIAFSHDASIVASGSRDGTIRFWRTSTGDCIQELKGHSDYVESVAFSHDAELLASGSGDGKVRVWRVVTGDCLHILEGHTDRVHSITFSLNSVFIASASRDHTIRIWNTDSGKCVRELQLHGSIPAIAFSRDSSLLASASKNGAIRLWRVETGDCVHERELQVHSSDYSSATFSSDLGLLSIVSHWTIQLWRIDTGECARTFSPLACARMFGPHAFVGFAACSCNSDFIASASNDGTIRLWRLDTGDYVQMLKVNSDMYLDHIAFSSDLSLIAVSWMKTRIRLWPFNVNSDVQEADAQSDMQEQGISGDRVTDITFSYDSALVASASLNDGIVSLWCAKTGRLMRELRGHSREVRSIAFSHDSLLLASASTDGTVKIWCTNTGECIQELHHREMVIAVAFSHDSVLLASVSGDGLRLWRTDTGECVRVPDKMSSVEFGSMSVAFSHDSALIALGMYAGAIKILCVATGAHVQTLRGLNGIVKSITFSQDSTLLAAAAHGAFSQDPTLLAATAHPTLFKVAVTAEGGSVQLWRIDTGECLQHTPLGALHVWLSSDKLSISSDHSRILTEFGSIAIDSGDIADTQVPAHFLGIGVRLDYSWITWNNHHILRLPAELGACRSAISGSNVAIGCTSGRVIIIRLSSEELSKIYDGIDNNGIA